jgi:hypothetical protein
MTAHKAKAHSNGYFVQILRFEDWMSSVGVIPIRLHLPVSSRVEGDHFPSVPLPG